MKARLGLALLGGMPLVWLYACGSAPPGAVTAAAPPPDAAFVTGEDAETRDATSPAVLLPSGDYEITTEVTTDTCSKGDAGALAPVTMFVPMKVWRDRSGRERLTGNFPLPLPRARGFGSARSDIRLTAREPGGEETTIIRGLGSQCPTYETRTRYHVLEVGADRVRFRYVRTYGDASTCSLRSPPPSNCTLDYVYDLRLVTTVCDPHCAVSFAKGERSDAGPRVHCQCGDAGTP